MNLKNFTLLVVILSFFDCQWKNNRKFDEQLNYYSYSKIEDLYTELYILPDNEIIVWNDLIRFVPYDIIMKNFDTDSLTFTIKNDGEILGVKRFIRKDQNLYSLKDTFIRFYQDVDYKKLQENPILFEQKIYNRRDSILKLIDN
ncbi:MAG: hypothetical protein R2766_13660 [Saprospiraceae bacterium]